MVQRVLMLPFTDSRPLHISRCTNAHNISLRVSLTDKCDCPLTRLKVNTNLVNLVKVYKLVLYLINCDLTALSELGFLLAVFDDFFAVVAHRHCHWGV
jgi:hypothetical protein